MRPPSDRPKTRMKRKLETTGAATVCDHSLRTRSTSRAVRAARPRWRSARAAITPSKLAARPPEQIADQRGETERERQRARLAQAIGGDVAGQAAHVEVLVPRLGRGRRRLRGRWRRGPLGLGLGLRP